LAAAVKAFSGHRNCLLAKCQVPIAKCFFYHWL